MKQVFRFISIAVLLLLAACSNSTPVEVLESQIVGGANATPGQFPYTAALRFNGNYRCGASIIRAQWVITAAHCVNDSLATPGQISIVAGEHNRTLVEGTEQTRAVTKIFIQPGISDIAILKLATPLTLNTRVRTIGFGAAPAVLSTATVAGWGQTGAGVAGEEPLANVLKYYVSTVTLVSPEYVVTQGNFTDAKRRRGESACYGDSGSGLAQPNSLSVMRLIGVVSYGNQECKSGQVWFGRPTITWVNQTILAN